MSKRIVASFLWFYTAWYGLAMAAELGGLPSTELVGPLFGLAVAGLIGVDPLGRIWARPARRVVAEVEHLPEPA